MTVSASVTESVMPGTGATWARSAVARALILSPRASMASGEGPTQVIPASMMERAKSASSDRNPYPGWMASAPVVRASSSSAAASV